MTPDLGIEPGPHWWKVSALTTAPSLHPELEGKRFCRFIPHNLLPERVPVMRALKTLPKIGNLKFITSKLLC